VAIYELRTYTFQVGKLAEAVGDLFVIGRDVVRVSDRLAEGVGMLDQPSISVVVVADWLNAARVGDLQQSVSRVVTEVGRVAFSIREAHKVARRVSGVSLNVARGVGDLGDAALRVAGEDDALADE